MTIDKSSLTKRYYTITEVAKMFDVSNSLLRYWEGEFVQIKPRKTSSGIRKYTADDILVIEMVFDLVKNRGYTIDGARKALKGEKSGTGGTNLNNRLTEIKSRLLRIRSLLDKMN